MKPDEVYQAALEAGSGGIRWNDSTNMIQLMDTNKNWIDWRYYNPNYKITHDLTVEWANPQTANISLSKRGLYCLTTSGYLHGASTSDSNTITTNGIVLNSIYYYIGPDHLFKEQIIFSDGTNTASLTMGSNNYGSFKTAIYIGPYENISNPESINFSNATTQGTKTITTHNQFIHMTTCGHTAYSKNFTTTDIENDHISIYQGTYNLYSAGCINSFGSVTCTATAGVTSSNVGTFVITNYTLVE